MDKNDRMLLFGIALVFAVFYFVPQGSAWFEASVLSGIGLLGEYAKQHVLTCLVPALFIAGAISVFIRKERVMKYLGHEANKWVSYGVASVAGAILAVCSCTILPLFAGIRKRGAGLGPAVTLLFAGPAINIAAIFLTFSVLGAGLGLARAVSAIVLSIIAGLSMQMIFREKPDKEKIVVQETEESKISNAALAVFFASLVGILVVNGLQIGMFLKYSLMVAFTLVVIGTVLFKFRDHATKAWLGETWSFAKVLLPLLFIGVFIAGFIMPLLPQALIESTVGRNDVAGNLIASVFGAFMYFSTLTEIPIVQALMLKGMAGGPALALLLAGPSLSLPNMLVIRKILGTKKTAVYVLLVILYSTAAGLAYGAMGA
ncbi:MAG: permease [Candidatus Aenigmatarchaeota archaeon]